MTARQAQHADHPLYGTDQPRMINSNVANSSAINSFTDWAARVGHTPDLALTGCRQWSDCHQLASPELCTTSACREHAVEAAKLPY